MLRRLPRALRSDRINNHGWEELLLAMWVLLQYNRFLGTDHLDRRIINCLHRLTICYNHCQVAIDGSLIGGHLLLILKQGRSCLDTNIHWILIFVDHAAIAASCLVPRLH